MPDHLAEVTLGSVLFNWQPERWRDFYYRIADEAPVGTVYVGEVVCAKRAPLVEPYRRDVVERLTAANKQVVFSTLSQVALRQDRKLIDHVCAPEDGMIEANDAAALFYLRGRPHHIGPFVNTYNERTVAFLVAGGASNFCLPGELPASGIRALCDGTRDLDATVEVQVFGRVSLALSARCYHARAHGRTRDSCKYVCDEDPDGLVLDTIEGQPFLTVNGIQTLSYDYLNLINELAELRAMGVTRFRLSPHSCDMVEVAWIFRDMLDRRIDQAEAAARFDALRIPAPFSNGFYYRKPGHSWSPTAVSVPA